jgi:transcriptional regulator with XRE-family HTH domain
MTISELIRSHRLKMGLSQEKLGKALGVQRAFICKIENGTKPIPLKYIDIICRVLKIKKEQFLKTYLSTKK